MKFLSGPSVATVSDHERPWQITNWRVAQMQNVGGTGYEPKPGRIESCGIAERAKFHAWDPAVWMRDQGHLVPELHQRLAEPIHYSLSTAVQRRRHRPFPRVINRNVQ